MSWNPGVLPLAGVFGSKAVFWWRKSRIEVERIETTRPLEKEIPIGNHHFYGLC